jgi:diaminopimelate epimerase
MRFAKCHGAGNDFVVVDARALDKRWDELARKMCDRHFGVGSDGLVLVLPSQTADLRMRMFNPDGSEAEACGNGLRCFVKYAFDQKLAGTPDFRVETQSGVRSVRVFLDAAGMVTEAEVGMGVPRFAPEEIPAQVVGHAAPVLELKLSVLDRAIPVSLVSMGNPHAVTFLTESVTAYPLDRIGPAIEHHATFPARVNFEIAHVQGRHDIQARVWERGTGETLACGSGACAIVVAAQLLGRCDPVVRVHLPGGVLTVTWDGTGSEAILRGPAQQVFNGDWPD